MSAFVCRLLRERDDLRWVGLGVWEKIAEVPEARQ